MPDGTKKQPSDASLRAFAEEIAAGVVLCDRTGSIEWLNPAAEALFGQSGEDLAGASLFETVPDLNMPEHARGVAHETELLRGDGGKTPVSIAIRQADVSGEPKLVCTINARPPAAEREKELAKKVALLQTTLDSMAQGISLTDADLNVVSFNQAFLDMLEFPTDMFHVGDPFEKFIRYNAERGEYGPGDHDQQVRERVDLAKQFKPHVFERARPDGTVMEIRGNPAPRSGFITTYTDVTERKRIEEALRQSEARLAGIADNLPGAVYQRVLYPDGRISFSYLSAGFGDMFGIDPATALKDPKLIVAALYPEDRERYRNELEESARTLAPFDHEFRFVNQATGETRWARSMGQPLRREDGAVVWDGISLDITNRKEAETLNTRFGRIVEESLSEVFVFDANTLLFTQVNRGARENLGYSVEEMAKLTAVDIKPEHTQETFTKLAEPLRSGASEQLSFETHHLRKDGSTYDVEVRLQFMATETPPVFVAVIQDITARKMVEHEIRATKESAEIANRSKSEFLANMSHELRTPLNAVIGFSETMIGNVFGPVPAPYDEYAKDIHNSGNYLLSLINDILDLSKIEAGKFELDDEEVDLHDVLDSCLRLIKERVENAGLQLDVRAAEDLPPVLADKRAIKQILLNLMTNAVKFTPEGGRVTIEAAVESNGGLRLTVTDTGIGVAPEHIASAFSAFGQVESALTRTTEGTGLGLPMVKSLMELHGGTVTMDSELEKGTTVTVRFPPERAGTAAAAAAKAADTP